MSLRKARKPGESLMGCLIRQRRYNHADGHRKEFVDELMRFNQTASKLYALGMIGVADVSPLILDEPASVDLTAMGEEVVEMVVQSEPLEGGDSPLQPAGPCPGEGVVQ